MSEYNGRKDSGLPEAPSNVLQQVPNTPEMLYKVSGEPSQLTDNDIREPNQVSSGPSDEATSQHYSEPSNKAEGPVNSKEERSREHHRSTVNFQRCEEAIKLSKEIIQRLSKTSEDCIEDLRRCKEGHNSVTEKLQTLSHEYRLFNEANQRYNKTHKRSNQVDKPSDEDSQRTPISSSSRKTKITQESVDVQQKSSNVQGIEGSDNSCYMDASLNSLFLFNDKFQAFLASSKSESVVENDVEHVWKLLEDEIVKPLQRDKTLELKTETMSKFRVMLSDFNPSYSGSEMDPEEFLASLFGLILKIPGFYLIDGDDEGSHVFQTYADMAQPTYEIDVQDLIEYSFRDSDIKLADIPKPGFIVKMPVTDGRRMVEKIYPNPTIDLTRILKNGEARCGDGALMQLSAVICLKSHHYTTYVREGVENNIPWWYLDSFAYSRGKQLTDKERTLGDPELLDQDEGMSFIMTNCYMCFYLPMSTGMEQDLVS